MCALPTAPSFWYVATALLGATLGCGGSKGGADASAGSGGGSSGTGGAASMAGTTGTTGSSGSGGGAGTVGAGGGAGMQAGAGGVDGGGRGGAGGTAGAAGSGGAAGGDPCHPACQDRLFGGCAPDGTCTYGPGTACYSNGVIAVSLTPGGPTRQTLSKNGVLCATLDAIGVWRDPNGAPLGTIDSNSDGSATLHCTGEAPVTVPKSCTIPCVSGMCPP